MPEWQVKMDSVWSIPVTFGFYILCEVSAMNTMTIREQLYKQIDNLADEYC